MGITTESRFKQAWDDLKALGEVTKDPAQVEAERIATMERELIGRKIPGYFPTPDKIAADMVYAASIQPGHTILEPSAGKGNIADAIRAKHPNNPLDVLEWDGDLLAILKSKGYNVVGTDFLKHTKKYDRIIMNPPFEQGQDIDHVQHAYELLKPGGHIISIMSEGTFGRSDKKATAFRKWLQDLRGTDSKLPAQAFQASDRPTGVATRMVFIEKRR
ncbi:MAG: methyltransferase [Planctomycetota bacterium]